MLTALPCQTFPPLSHPGPGVGASQGTDMALTPLMRARGFDPHMWVASVLEVICQT